jgi:transposase
VSHRQAYLGLVPRRCQSGEVDYTGSISALAIARRSTLRKARIALAIIMHAMRRHGTEFKPA